jgi:hypothetical protein
MLNYASELPPRFSYQERQEEKQDTRHPTNYGMTTPDSTPYMALVDSKILSALAATKP